MIRALRAAAAAALIVAVPAAAAQTAPAAPCVPAAQAEALVLFVAPSLVTATRELCLPNLGADAYLRRSGDRLVRKLAPEGEAAWPGARAALARIIGPSAAGMLESELARPMVASMVPPMLLREVRAADCPRIDRILALIDPLPARNTAGLMVAVFEMAARARGARPPITVCAAS